MRKKGEGTLPVPGWTSAYDWQGSVAGDRILQKQVDALLADFAIAHKVRYERGRFSTLSLSDGQKRRLALRAQDKAVMVISHDDRYFDVADKLIVMEDGKINRIEDRTLPKDIEELEMVATSRSASSSTTFPSTSSWPACAR